MEKIGTLLSQRDQTDIIRIGVLPIDGFALMSYASTVEPFRAANMLSRRMLYEVVNISPSLESVSSSGAASVAPQATLLTAPRLDYVFVVAGGNPATFADMAVGNWLAKIVLALPAVPATRVVRPMGNPPMEIPSKPSISVANFSTGPLFVLISPLLFGRDGLQIQPQQDLLGIG